MLQIRLYACEKLNFLTLGIYTGKKTTRNKYFCNKIFSKTKVRSVTLHDVIMVFHEYYAINGITLNCEISLKANVATDEGNGRNEM